MKGKRPPAGELRRRAEERLAVRDRTPQPDAAEALRLVHELQVHQVELELQNEELRATRSALETSSARYRELFDFAPIGYAVLAADRTVLELNLAAARLLGIPRAEAIGKPLERFVPDDPAPLLRFAADILSSTPESPPRGPIDLAIGPRTGAPVPARLTGALLDGGVPALLVALEDLTERRRAEDALRDQLVRRDEFLGTLSHELRNPLAPIRSGLYLLERAPPGGDAARRAMGVIERQVAHLTRIVDDLLDVTRIARGKLALRPEVQNLHEVIRRTLEDHRSAFEARGVALAAELPAGRLWADVDGTRIAQVLGNLLVNALKFTGPGGHVAVAARADGGRALVSVRDDGAGIAPDVLAHVFEPFAQGPQPLSRSSGGLGLGLATVKGLVELHGGSVAIASEGPGRGTEVTIALPRAAAPRAGAGAAARPHGPTHRVLVIDDNVDAATCLADVLETSGHEVRVAFDGTTGLARAREFAPEIVVCDIGLPGMDGYEVARALRADDRLRGAYLIALSGYARPEDVARARAAGFDRHVAKPPSLERLETLFGEAPSPAAR